MEIIKISEERMEQLLPQNIKESDVLSIEAKKVLATLINYQFTHPKAIECGFVAISNSTLREATAIGQHKFFPSVQELIEYKLITRKVGMSRTKGDTATASEYYIQFDNLEKPLKKLTYEELLSRFRQSSGNPSGTANPNPNANTNTYTNTYTNSDSDSKSESESNTNTNYNTNIDIYSDSDAKSESDNNTNIDNIINYQFNNIETELEGSVSNKKNNYNINDEDDFEIGFQNHHKVDTKLLYENWCINLNKCKTKDELKKTIEESVEQYQDNIEDFEDTNYFERYKEKCDYRYAILKNK